MIKYVLIGYLIIVNTAAFALFAADKRRAVRNKWRIPEATLILVAAIGGSVGALCGMHFLHHKTKHAKFYLLVPTFFFIHAAVFSYAFWKFT